jgi:outer membrane protein assembly factor BamE (lipoprotein component of BamABCDE complex)
MIVSISWLAGCANVGNKFETAKVVEIKAGETRQAEILELLGQPWRKGLENGALTWTYAHYRYSAFSPFKSDDLVIKFENNGVVKSYTFNTSENLPEIK